MVLGVNMGEIVPWLRWINIWFSMCSCVDLRLGSQKIMVKTSDTRRSDLFDHCVEFLAS